MPNNTCRNIAQKLLTTLDNPQGIAGIRRDLALYVLGLSTGLVVAKALLWAAIAAFVGLWLLWRAQAKQEPKLKLSQSDPPQP